MHSVAAAARALPILTFDDAALSPSFGYVFNTRWLGPYESIVSILWKFARMNALPGPVLVGQLCSRPLDPYEGICASPADVETRRVAGILGVPMKMVRYALGSPSGRRPLDSHLRHCPRCMSRGYHSIVHQFLGEMQCPAHGDWLEQGCSACGYVAEYRLDAQLLDAPYRCPRCRRSYGRCTINPWSTTPLPKRMRTAMTRAYFSY
jgi:hypothetical protein